MTKSVCPKCDGNKRYIDYVRGSTPCELCAETGFVMPYAAALPEVDAPVAYVPIHPRNGPLWANTVPTLESDRPANYEVMPLYAHPSPQKATR